MKYDYDLLVIGAGSGGVRAARIAAGYGKRVAICEGDKVGGTCVIRGCVPKKLFVYASQYSKMFKAAKTFGWDIQSQFNWPELLQNKDAEINRLNGIYLNLLANAGVELIRGFGTFVDAHNIKIAEKTYSAERILIATGGSPTVPDIPGKEHVITSNEALDLPQLPASITINGGGYIAVEFACIFNALGVKVNLVYRGPQILRTFDSEIAAFAQQSFIDAGINVFTDTSISAVEKTEAGLVCKSNQADITSDVVFFATGRQANTERLNLTKVGIATQANGQVVVDEEQRTSLEHVFAVGDVSNQDNLTPVAIREGHYLVDRLYAGGEQYPDYDFIPTTVFCQPEIGTCGLTEDEARAQHANIKTYTSTFRAMKYAMSDVNEKTLMKIVVNEDTDQVLGMHVCGADGGEMIQGFGVALKQGLTKTQLNSTIGIHPTSAEEFVTL
ncbi:glutathione-disulfide reductase [Marinicella sp. S1101]|uniref:glutathione-disulfide reductase n=1 Tax=Marinicella marina TaxID=2996016 RepID=UPI002260D14E|nr:glutathione-disulfide reductase [Marinicella marina]MCX7554310.1 glutathione-disulfide reductase [Marinicella marina]MDJ1138699.1 glutathione-disulfide reductase [Marinicella marina]